MHSKAEFYRLFTTWSNSHHTWLRQCVVLAFATTRTLRWKVCEVCSFQVSVVSITYIEDTCEDFIYQWWLCVFTAWLSWCVSFACSVFCVSLALQKCLYHEGKKKNEEACTTFQIFAACAAPYTWSVVTARTVPARWHGLQPTRFKTGFFWSCVVALHPLFVRKNLCMKWVMPSVSHWNLY